MPSPKGSRIEAADTVNAIRSRPADERQVHLEADDEHEQHQPELGQHVEVGPHVSREQQLVQVAGQRAEQAGAQGDAGDDLPDHRRLAQPDGQPPDQAGDHHDDGQTHEDVGDDLGRGVLHGRLPGLVAGRAVRLGSVSASAGA